MGWPQSANRQRLLTEGSAAAGWRRSQGPYTKHLIAKILHGDPPIGTLHWTESTGNVDLACPPQPDLPPVIVRRIADGPRGHALVETNTGRVLLYDLTSRQALNMIGGTD